MASLIPPSNCTIAIAAHTDIDGIGTRIATYCQLLFAILTLAIAPRHGIGSWWAVIITSLGLQITAIVEHEALSLYHALIVTWLTFPVFMMTFYYGLLAWGRSGFVTEVVIGMVLHGSIFIGFCFWVWGTAPSFGDDVACNSEVKFALFSLFNPTGGVRTFALFVITLFALFMLCIFLFLGCYSAQYAFTLISPFMNRWQKGPTPSYAAPIISRRLINMLNHVPPLHTTVAVLTTINLCSLILSICQIESMIAANAWLITPGSEEWTFGQILSIILLTNPLLNFFKVVKIEYEQKESLEHRPAASLCVQVHKKWKSARDSGFSLKGSYLRGKARDDDISPGETKTLPGLPSYNVTSSPYLFENAGCRQDEKAEHDGEEQSQSYLPRVDDYAVLSSCDDTQYARSRLSDLENADHSSAPSYHTLVQEVKDDTSRARVTSSTLEEHQHQPLPSLVSSALSLSSPMPSSPSGSHSGGRTSEHSPRRTNPSLHVPRSSRTNSIPPERYNTLRSFWDRRRDDHDYVTTDSRRSRGERERDMFIS
ncbi:hypothetical protein D9758_004436 [Tetrapyrgos nigripes]|uniref:Uncharacterized protein n=1 Tax=Tetrapyrgos nigripes TaxID=182062 RepID=A0A8H5LSR6_9AGAR|nr:hypothetical protein D9758_004436 [Tetrapyrgos nigripes]